MATVSVYLVTGLHADRHRSNGLVTAASATTAGDFVDVLSPVLSR
jgi:hypothetical protein